MAGGHRRQHADDDRHIPAARTPGVLDMLLQGAVVVIDEMSMDSAIGMYVDHFMRVHLGRLVVVGETVMIVA